PPADNRHLAILRLPSDTPFLQADTSTIKTAIAQLSPELCDGISSVARRDGGFLIAFSSPETLQHALEQHEKIAVTFSGTLSAVVNQVGYVLKRVPRHISLLATGLVPTKIEDILDVVEEKTGTRPLKAMWSTHDSEFSPVRTAIIFFKEKMAPFELWGSALSQPYIPHPKIPQCSACWEFHSTHSCRRNMLCEKIQAMKAKHKKQRLAARTAEKAAAAGSVTSTARAVAPPTKAPAGPAPTDSMAIDNDPAGKTKAVKDLHNKNHLAPQGTGKATAAGPKASNAPAAAPQTQGPVGPATCDNMAIDSSPSENTKAESAPAKKKRMASQSTEKSPAAASKPLTAPVVTLPTEIPARPDSPDSMAIDVEPTPSAEPATQSATNNA
ncbi:hypothetical protein SEPCBS119000_006769, partial [Sporothrix epigloea]